MKHRLLTLDLRSEAPGQPKHERLKDYFVNEMLVGRLKPGQALPSLHHLAESLGVARMTICQAMNSLENQGLIRRVQGKGTFVEADVRRKLQRGQTLFALVAPETRTGFYPSLLHGFEVAAAAVHYQTIVCSTDNNVQQQGDIVLQLIDKEVSGVAMVPTSQPLTPLHQIRQLQKHGIPVVFCHRRVDGITAPLLAIPFRQLARLGGKILAERGHRRTAYVSAMLTPLDPVLVEAMGEGMREAGCDAATEAVYAGDSIHLCEEKVFAGLQQVFAKHQPPTAIFAPFDPLAEMIYLLMPRLGLRVPEDVSLLGFGGAFREGPLTRRLTSIVVDEIATGRKAVSLLHEMHSGERPIDDNEEFALELDLYEGETLVAPASRNTNATTEVSA
jgi:GntR family transcriptional regulator, arabinose operon transcriptional repressor